MRKKIIFIFLLLTISLFLVPRVFACSIDARPHFHIRTPKLDKCYFVSYEENLTPDTDVIQFINDRTKSKYVNCEGLVLSDSEQQVFRKVINQFNKQYYGFGSVNIEKQSDSKYKKFTKQVEKINSDTCDCDKYANVARYGDWTVYEKLSKCGHDSMCQAIPPEGCPRRIPYDFFRDNPNLSMFISLFLYLLFFTGVIIMFMFLVKYLIKKLRNKRC